MFSTLVYTPLSNLMFAIILILTSQKFGSYVKKKPDNILDSTRLKAFADNILTVAQIMEFVYQGVANIVGKGENAGYQHFSLFPQCFKNSSRLVCKIVIVLYRVKLNSTCENKIGK